MMIFAVMLAVTLSEIKFDIVAMGCVVIVGMAIFSALILDDLRAIRALLENKKR